MSLAMTNRVLVGVVFLAGCAVGGVSSQLVVPKASAQQAATLTKWEVTCFEENNDERAVFAANERGEERWELVTAETTRDSLSRWCFKRPKM